MTDWLTDDEQRAWRGLLHMTAQLNARLARQLQDEHELSLPDYDVLARLYEAPEEGLRARELEAGLSWEQSRLSHQLARMQRRGLVERRRLPDRPPRRHVRHHATPAAPRSSTPPPATSRPCAACSSTT